MDEVVDTHSAILVSAVELLRERTFEDISFLELAEATELSERTIYRHFPTRSHLLATLGRWIETELFPLERFQTPAQFRAAACARFRAFDAGPGYAIVAARAASLSTTAEPTAAASTVAIAAMVSASAPALNGRDVMRTTALLCYFASPLFWARMRVGFDASADEIAAAFDEAMKSVLPAATRASWAA